MDNAEKTLLINLISNEDANVGKALRVGHKFLAVQWQVVLSLNIEAVKLLDPTGAERRCAVAQKPYAKMLQSFLANGGRILVGAECLTLAGLNAEHLMPGMELAKFPLIEEILSRPEVRTMTW